MAEVTFTYQILMKAVSAATDASGSVYPDDYNYVSIPLETVKSIVAAFDPEISSSEARNSHDQARRLWYKFKEHYPHCACGIVRLLSPVPNDLVGIVTEEDLLGIDAKMSKGTHYMDREMLNDDLSELNGVPASFSHPIQPSTEADGLKPPRRSKEKQESPDLSPKVEMTLIETQTREIFKRSRDGEFGEGRWPVSKIRAFAVWF
jgi:hypothetical protein